VCIPLIYYHPVYIQRQQDSEGSGMGQPQSRCGHLHGRGMGQPGMLLSCRLRRLRHMMHPAVLVHAC
jgi:hypothetical protein